MFRLGSRTAAKTISVMAAAISVAAVLVFYAVSDPAHGKFHPKCLFHLLTGLECPGCGSQRALHCLLNGDLLQALHYNALMVAAIPYAVLYAVSLLAVRHASARSSAESSMFSTAGMRRLWLSLSYASSGLRGISLRRSDGCHFP